MKTRLLLLLVIAVSGTVLWHWMKNTPAGERLWRSIEGSRETTTTTFADEHLHRVIAPYVPVDSRLPDEEIPFGPAEPVSGTILVRDGLPLATLVNAAQPSEAAAFAVREINAHIRKITGTELPVAHDGMEVTGTRLLVGESEGTRALKLRNEDFESQEYTVLGPTEKMPDTFVIMGRDRSGRRNDQPRWCEGKWGKGMEFTGGQFLYIPDSGFDDKSGSIEVSVEVPAEGFAESGTIFRLQGRDDNGMRTATSHLLETTAANVVNYVVISPDGQRSVLFSPPLKPGWHTIRTSHSASIRKVGLWVNGVSCGTAPYSPTALAGAAMSVGALTPHHWAERAGVTNALRGRIDGLKVSKSASPPVRADGPPTADADTTLLVNFDEGRGAPADAGPDRRVVEPPWYFEDRGTLDAAYDFLERFCGVRWYLPGELGTVAPKTKTLIVSAANVRRKPAMDYRWMVWSPILVPGPEFAAISDADATLWKLRMRLGGNPYQANHSFTGFYEEYLKQHPDWFAQGYEGKPPQPCFSSEGLLQQVIKDARDYYDGKGLKPMAMGMGDYFAVVPQDSESWCKCPKCQAKLDPRYDEKFPLWMNGRASNYVFGFVNDVAKEVGKTHPDKFIAALAYSKYGYFPEKIALEPNIAVQLCLQPRNWYSPAMRDNDIKTLAAWAPEAAKRPFYLWLYYCFPALQTWSQKWQFFPGFFAHSVIAQMDSYHKAGVRGMFVEHSSEYGQTFLMDQLELYLTWKLADDPTLDGARLIDEFFTAYYGKAGPAMKELYQSIESTYMTADNYPADVRNKPGQWHQTEQIAWQYLGTPERMRKFAKLMERAKNEAGTRTAAQRVALFEEGIWKPMTRGAAAWAAKSSGGEARERLATQTPPTFTVPRVAAAAGDPRKVDWSLAQSTSGDWFTVEGDPAFQNMKASFAHDGTHLYIRTEHLRDATGLVSHENIWGGDDWEIFLAPNRDAQPRQFMLNPAGKTASVGHDNSQGVWNSGAVGISETADRFAWRAYFAFPLDRAIPGGAKPGMSIFANIYRSNQLANEFFALSPNFERTFRTSQRMVELKLKE